MMEQDKLRLEGIVAKQKDDMLQLQKQWRADRAENERILQETIKSYE